MNDLRVLFPKSVVADVGGRSVTIRPVTLKDFDEFGEASGNLLAMIASASPAQVYAYAKKSGALKSILGSCTDMPAWRVGRLPAASAVELMIQVIAVNSSFFDQALVRAASLLTGAVSSRD